MKNKKKFKFTICDKESGKMLYQWETTFTDNGQGFNSPLFAMSLLRHQEDQLKELTEIKMEEVIPQKGVTNKCKKK